MDFATWEPVYEAILADFGYDRTTDERARDVLASLTTRFPLAEQDCSELTVAVAGAGPSLESDAERAADADAVIAASTAVDRLAALGIGVDWLVTDLDKNPETARRLTENGVPVAVHAHGDNIDALETHVPTFDGTAVLPTTQAEPVGPVRNLGGFTDGDRAAFLADHLGAGELVFPGWDFDDETVGTEKRRKLVWAERLLHWLERRRGDRFAVLDDRRDGIELTALPD